MPSICRRPKLHHAVEIEGQACWDGGYAANPAVFPLLFDCASRDLLLVPLGPLQREGTSRTSRTSRTVEAIDSRILELGFGANFMRQMRLLAHAARLARPVWRDRGGLDRRLQQLRFHLIDADQLPSLQRSETQALLSAPSCAACTRRAARAAAWLDEHAAGIGRRSTVDLPERSG